ncbi:hypothetical protein LX32DRAFT_179521 [Colletotrichum zoysiae]|uniref:Uncharacterized protein n=1 Tax=Colletotrichum zoysiae TaxID=1216348 RepID=A0AAD9H7F3_9PEZI|nr:hypothetical protein LX32DRAFT_179521 [Colletotrichum zoysiae]
MGWPDNTAPPLHTLRFSPIHAYTTFLHIPPLFLLHICIPPLQHAVGDHNHIYAGELHLVSQRIMRLLCAFLITFFFNLSRGLTKKTLWIFSVFETLKKNKTHHHGCVGGLEESAGAWLFGNSGVGQAGRMVEEKPVMLGLADIVTIDRLRSTVSFGT